MGISNAHKKDKEKIVMTTENGNTTQLKEV